MSDEIKDAYEALAKQHTLPAYEQLNQEFELDVLDDDRFLLRNIMRKIADKLMFFNNLINDVVAPDTSSVFAMHEAHFFSDIEKGQLAELYKRLMKINRAMLVASMENDEAVHAQSIVDANTEWLQVKKDLMNPIKKLKACWDQSVAADEELGYLG